MAVETTIHDRLTARFLPDQLAIENESHLHHGHHGSPQTGESHFRLMIVSKAFSGISRIERHRLVNAELADLLAGPLHALAVKAMAPEEVMSQESSR